MIKNISTECQWPISLYLITLQTCGTQKVTFLIEQTLSNIILFIYFFFPKEDNILNRLF